MRKVPELSLLSFVQGGDQDRVKFVDQLFTGIKEYGFIILKDHTVEQSKIDRAYEMVHQFFSLDEATKRKYISPDGGGQRGFTPFGSEHAKDYNHPDLKEFWHVGRELSKDHPRYQELKKFYPDNIWPTEVSEFKKTMSEIYSAMDSTSVILLEALGIALDLPERTFANMVDQGNSILRLINYPPIETPKDELSVRAAAHEDINLITMLVGATDSGLELLDRDGSWLPVSTRPGEIVVDSGDMLSRITNEVIPATTHRVVNPEDTSTTRYSMPFFVHPHPNAELKCIPSCVGEGEKYPPISSHDFLMQRLREIGLV